MSGDPQLILASSSPRRQTLLCQLGVRFIVKPSAVDEISRPAESPQHFVQRMARTKAEAAWRLNAKHQLPVLAADTVVVVDDTMFGKPTTSAAALAMLARLSGRVHRVLTAVVVMNATRQELKLCETLVTLRAVSQEEALQYWQTGEPLDKAGGYAYRGSAPHLSVPSVAVTPAWWGYRWRKPGNCCSYSIFPVGWRHEFRNIGQYYAYRKPCRAGGKWCVAGGSD